MVDLVPEGGEREGGREPPGSRSVRRFCHVCQAYRATKVCPPCGVDLDTGEVVAPPAELTGGRRDAEEGAGEGGWRARPARPLRDLALRSLVEARRGLFGSLVGFGLLLLCLRFGAAPLALIVVAFLVVERARAARYSPVLEDEPAPLPLDALLRGERPPPREAPRAERRLGPWDVAVAGLEGLGATLVCGPFVALSLSAEVLDALAEAGVLAALADHPTWARASAVGTVFVVAAGLALAVRSFGPVGAEGRRSVGAEDTTPFEFLAMGKSILGLPVAYLPLFALGYAPLWAAAPVLAGLPLLAGALAEDSFGALRSTSLVAALRLTPRYALVAALSAPLLLVTATATWWLPVPAGLAAPVVLVAATLTGVLAGVARYDAARPVRRRPPGGAGPPGERPVSGAGWELA